MKPTLPLLARRLRALRILTLSLTVSSVLFAAHTATADPAVGPVPAHASARVATVQVRVAPDHRDWTYTPGEPVKFTINVTADNEPLEGAIISYQFGPEKFTTSAQTVTVPAGGLVIDGGTMDAPGFLTCIATTQVGGRTYRGLATAGFSPEKIQPTQTEPADFDAFWQAGLDELKKVPLDPTLQLVPESSTGKFNVYHVSFRTIGAAGPQYFARIYGMLSVPKAPGKYPAILHVPGAGVRPYGGVRTEGAITLQIGIHGIPVNLPNELYDHLRTGALDGYPTYNLDNRDRYYYRRVYLSCVQANNFLTSQPEWDGKNLAVTGGSQGGQLTLVTAGLDSRVTALAAHYPAYCDVTGYLHGRAGGWPHMFRPKSDGSAADATTVAKITTTGYYDAVNFARRIKAPGHYTWGYNDETCPPTSMYAAYNVITAPKTLTLALEAGHAPVPEESAAARNWLGNFLGLK
ncbi:acetylxylan esterase [Geminisphaera colitermitum]|uniref:acetylxylan esterase n=1 Tax=Geminisphaera colitermitum TaxID=1148786 RepID=UPI0001965023|nr:acetylxylan esterase [Geminisphaera colitermitum]